VKDGVLNVYGSKINLPPILKDLANGTYNLIIPTDAISEGNMINATISHINKTTEKDIFTLKNGDEYLFFTKDMGNELEVGKNLSLDIDIKRIKFENEENQVEPLCLENNIEGLVMKRTVPVKHITQKNKEITVKETCCDILIKDRRFTTNAKIGLKLLNLKENKAFKDKIGIKFSPYHAYLSRDDGLAAVITEIFDYGKESFFEIELPTGEKYIIFANDKEMKVGDTVYLNIDINNVEAYNLKNNIRLL